MKRWVLTAGMLLLIVCFAQRIKMNLSYKDDSGLHNGQRKEEILLSPGTYYDENVGKHYYYDGLTGILFYSGYYYDKNEKLYYFNANTLSITYFGSKDDEKSDTWTTAADAMNPMFILYGTEGGRDGDTEKVLRKMREARLSKVSGFY